MFGLWLVLAIGYQQLIVVPGAAQPGDDDMNMTSGDPTSASGLIQTDGSNQAPTTSRKLSPINSILSRSSSCVSREDPTVVIDDSLWRPTYEQLFTKTGPGQSLTVSQAMVGLEDLNKMLEEFNCALLDSIREQVDDLVNIVNTGREDLGHDYHFDYMKQLETQYESDGMTNISNMLAYLAYEQKAIYLKDQLNLLGVELALFSDESWLDYITLMKIRDETAKALPPFQHQTIMYHELSRFSVIEGVLEYLRQAGYLNKRRVAQEAPKVNEELFNFTNGREIFADLLKQNILPRCQVMEQKLGERLKNIRPFAKFEYQGRVVMGDYARYWMSIQKICAIITNYDNQLVNDAYMGLLSYYSIDFIRAARNQINL